MIHYEIRTMRNAPVYSFDSLERARQERDKAEKKLKIALAIVEVTRHERFVK